jgi:ABC-type molybdenum transport system ATPase subunit/photorepair protein PhrA
MRTFSGTGTKYVAVESIRSRQMVVSSTYNSRAKVAYQIRDVILSAFKANGSWLVNQQFY